MPDAHTPKLVIVKKMTAPIKAPDNLLVKVFEKEFDTRIHWEI